mmetsp:Transcript_30307/g.34800  ORF Transcript_30307/g.34800 Transcript_30307/m.34800 type:complete len:377 (-) Transcript_30307:330-1460(-)
MFENMTRTVFGLLALALLSSFFPSSKGFSLTRLLYSSSNQEPCRNIKRKNCRCRNHRELDFLLRVATDPTTTDTISEDKEKNLSYDFISVEEAETHLQRERTRYEMERSELQRLLDLQSQQLQDLAEGQLGKGTEGGNNSRSRGGAESQTSTRMVVHDSSVGVINSIKKDRNKCNNKSDSNKKNVDTMLKMELLEARFRDALIDNEELTRLLHDQHREYRLERAALEDQLREEQDRLDYIRDKLHTERAYFETSRRMLERLLGEEEQKVHELEQELLILMTREHIFSEQKRSLEQQQYRQEQEQARKQEEEEQQHQQQRRRRRRIQLQVQEQKLREYNNSYNGNRNNQQRQEEIGMSVNPTGFSMNINDVQCPLFP